MSIRADNAKIAKQNQLSNVATIDVMPRALRQSGSPCHKPSVQPL
jgi:hypothetical protein